MKQEQGIVQISVPKMNREAIRVAARVGLLVHAAFKEAAAQRLQGSSARQEVRMAWQRCRALAAFTRGARRRHAGAFVTFADSADDASIGWNVGWRRGIHLDGPGIYIGNCTRFEGDSSLIVEAGARIASGSVVSTVTDLYSSEGRPVRYDRVTRIGQGSAQLLSEAAATEPILERGEA